MCRGCGGCIRKQVTYLRSRTVRRDVQPSGVAIEVGASYRLSLQRLMIRIVVVSIFHGLCIIGDTLEGQAYRTSANGLNNLEELDRPLGTRNVL